MLVFALFLAFEPYDYFGLRGSSDYLSAPLSLMRQLEREQPDQIILGDSRMANLNVSYIQELTGEPVQMMAFGGAETGEIIELFWYAAEHTQLKKVVLGLNLYSMLGEQGKGRIPAMEEMASDTGKFIIHGGHWLQAMNSGKMQLKNWLGGLLNRPDWMEYPEDPTDYTLVQNIPQEQGERYRADLEEYLNSLLIKLSAANEVQEETMEDILAIIRYCKEKEIELVIVFPPLHISVWELYDELGLLPEMEQMKAVLKAEAPVIDMEFPNDFTTNDDNFFDGFHLVSEKKLFLAKAIFTDLEDPCIQRTEPEGGKS